jgi:transcriptional regulator with XRE-family HTH domain
MQEQPTYKIQPQILLFIRQSSGMTEDEIAKKLKLSKAKYLNIEGGKENRHEFN